MSETRARHRIDWESGTDSFIDNMFAQPRNPKPCSDCLSLLQALLCSRAITAKRLDPGATP